MYTVKTLGLSRSNISKQHQINRNTGNSDCLCNLKNMGSQNEEATFG